MIRHTGWRRILMTSVLISHFLISSFSQSQSFFNLTADEVRIDTLLPVFNYAYPLGPNYADSTYEVTIEYPEFVPMESAEIVTFPPAGVNLRALSTSVLTMKSVRALSAFT